MRRTFTAAQACRIKLFCLMQPPISRAADGLLKNNIPDGKLEHQNRFRGANHPGNGSRSPHCNGTMRRLHSLSQRLKAGLFEIGPHYFLIHNAGLLLAGLNTPLSYSHPFIITLHVNPAPGVFSTF